MFATVQYRSLVPVQVLLAIACLLPGPAGAAVLAGKVITAKAQPVANALVSAGKTATRTDDNGYFQLQVPTQDAQLEVFQSAYGVAHSQVTLPETGVLVYLSPRHARVLQPAAQGDALAIQRPTASPRRAPAQNASLDEQKLCMVCDTYLPVNSGG